MVDPVHKNLSKSCSLKNFFLFLKKTLKKISSDKEKFESEGREFATFLRSLEQFIQTVKGQNNFW